MKKFFPILLVFLLINLSFSNLYAQVIRDTYVVDGTIKRLSGGKPFANVNVSIEGTKYGVQTNKDGYYIMSLPKGMYTIVFSHVGYETRKLMFEVTSKVIDPINFEMIETSIILDEVIVEDRAINHNVSDPKLGVNRLNIKTIKKLPAFMGEVDIIRSLFTLPGVTTVGEGATGFNVRGGSIDQNLVLMDDAPIFNSSHLMGFFSVFNPDVVKTIDFYRGGVPAQYGGRASSVLDIKLQTASEAQKFSIQGGIGLVASRLMLEGPIIKDKLHFILAARGSFSDFLFKYVPNNAVRGTKANFYDITQKLEYKISKKDRLYFTGYLGKDVFKLSGDSLALQEVNASSTRFEWQTTNGTLRWNHLFNDRIFTNLTAVVSDFQSNLINPEGDNAFEIRPSINYKNLKADINFLVGTNHQFDAGASVIAYDIAPGSLIPKAVNSTINAQIIPDEKSIESALYINDEWKISKRFTLMYGLRYSHFRAIGASGINIYGEGQAKDSLNIVGRKNYAEGETIATTAGFEPRLALKIGLTENSSFKFSYNRMRQYLQLVSNTTAALPTDRWKGADAYIKPQIADQFSIGYFQNLNNNTIELSAEIYYKTIENITDYKDGERLLLAKYIETILLQGKGQAYGFEFLLKKKLGKLTGWTTYTYSQTNLQISSIFASERINSGRAYPANYNKPHIFNLIANYQQSKQLSFSLNFTYSTGRPVTYPEDKYALKEIYIPNYVDRNNEQIPDYHRLDASMTIDPNPYKKRRWQNTWVFSIYNLYSRTNAYSVFFKPKNDYIYLYYNKVNAFQLSIFGSILPSITYNFKF